MPPRQLFDLSSIDTDTIIADREEIYRHLPHRYEFMQLDGIYLCDTEAGTMAAYRDVRADEFWVRGHIPGRPIFPGVLMIESAAHLVSYYVGHAIELDGFLGFSGVTDVKFRATVQPGQRVTFLGKVLDLRKRRCKAQVQAFVDDKFVFEGIITGMWV